MTQGSQILASEYNSIRNKVVEILGPGTGTAGYGQILTSVPVFSGNIITAAQWQALRNDIINIRLHQEGVISAIAESIQGQAIRFGGSEPNNQWSSILDQLFVSRFIVGGGRFLVVEAASESRTGSWSTQSQCEITITFLTADEARFFFNSGGKIRFFSTRTGGSSTTQNNAWTVILLNVGIQTFGGNFSDVHNFYNLNNSYRTILLRTLSTPYSMNFYRIEAKVNVVNNSTGGANILNFRITWKDDYIDPGSPPPGDEIDGTLSLTVEELKAVGDFLPTGSMNIVSPTYNITPISAV